MSDPIDEEEQRDPMAVPAPVADTARAVRVDLTRLHGTWMELVFSRGLGGDHSVVERREPGTTRGVVGYRLWAVLGALSLLVAYPLFVVGLATRFYSRRIDRLSAALGFAGVALVSLVVWGALTTLVYLLPVTFGGLVAVAVAGVVATVSALLAMYVTGLPGRLPTVVVGYPLGVTAVFLPPSVAALFSPTLASVVFPNSYSLAAWLLDNALAFGGIAAFFRSTFELQGLMYVGLWFVLAIPTGWGLGALVTLATRVRDSRDPEGGRESDADLLW